jgi:hypothetical protein
MRKFAGSEKVIQAVEDDRISSLLPGGRVGRTKRRRSILP